MPIAYGDETMAHLIKWTADHRASYISSGGVKGHIMDMRFLGGHRFEPMLLLRYVGRKSGKTMINGLGYTNFGGEIVIAASKGGADENPAWYLNIKAGGPLAIQIASQAFDVSWREPKDAGEREEVWKFVIKGNPIFADYRKGTTREIPLVLMTPLEEIPVFTD